jgi:hypothetical protein
LIVRRRAPAKATARTFLAACAASMARAEGAPTTRTRRPSAPAFPRRRTVPRGSAARMDGPARCSSTVFAVFAASTVPCVQRTRRRPECARVGNPAAPHEPSAASAAGTDAPPPQFSASAEGVERAPSTLLLFEGGRRFPIAPHRARELLFCGGTHPGVRPGSAVKLRLWLSTIPSPLSSR